MFLTWRQMHRNDFDTCRDLLLDKDAYDAKTYDGIPDLWGSLLQSGQMETGVVVDHERPAGNQTIGLATVVFPSDEFVTEMQAPDFPRYVNRQITSRWMQGRSPLLTKEQVCKANGTEGVNLLFFHCGILPEGEWRDNIMALCEKMLHISLEVGVGYHVRRMLIEANSLRQVHLCLNAGFHRLADETGQPVPIPEVPCLLTASNEQSLEGTTLGCYFLYRSPRLHFKDGEQQLLRRALIGETDEETAQALDVSLSTIHKRWMAIYERASRVLPDLFPGGASRGLDDVKRRGPEKRRHLLAYVQSHREELRPYPAPKRV